MVKRSDKVAYLGITTTNGTTTTTTYHRMTKFTSMGISKNPKEYTRQYVDEDFERNDVVGYNTSIAYAFDLEQDNPVHKDLAGIADNELIGPAAVRDIVVVDYSDETTVVGTYTAYKQSFSVVPGSEGDSTDVYTYTGTLKKYGEKITGTATPDTTKGVAIVTFTPDAD